MGSTVYEKHGVSIRRIVLDPEGRSGYEIHIRGAEQTLTDAEFRKMILAMAEHLMVVKRL